MKRIESILLAIAIATTATVFLSSCQEDAPEINYTMNVSVTNDFSKVIEAINNGNLKSEAAIAELVKAIDKLSGDQQTKLQAIIDALSSLNTTLETKLALIEAAMKAQTLSLEGKLSLLETAIKNQTIKQEELSGKLADAIDNLAGDLDTKLGAIETAITDQTASLETKLALIEAAMKAQTLSLEGKLDLLKTAIGNLPDYSSQLEAIKTAIAGLPDYSAKLDALKTAISALPDYSSKFDAVVVALTGIKTEIEALGTGQTDIATQIGNAVTAINSLVSEVSSGNTDAAAALALIIQKLEDLKTAIENIETGGGSGSGDSPEGALKGKFSVGAGKQVQFSKGNLVATIDATGAPTAWKFAANQYDCLGAGGANKTIGTAAGDVDLFGWSTAATTYGISTSTSNGDYSGDFVDWGNNIGDGNTWRTLTIEELQYLFNTRTNASSLYKYGVTVCGKDNCVIIAPDNWDTSANPLQTSYDATAWAIAEAAGLVCLPAAGYRDGSDVYYVGDYGFYRSSTANDEDFAYIVYFNSLHVDPDNFDYRYYGFSVRLITESN